MLSGEVVYHSWQVTDSRRSNAKEMTGISQGRTPKSIGFTTKGDPDAFCCGQKLMSKLYTLSTHFARFLATPKYPSHFFQDRCTNRPDAKNIRRPRRDAVFRLLGSGGRL